MPISLSRPEFPALAAAARITGEVEIRIGVRPDGSVETTEIVSGYPIIRDAAEAAARTSRFECRNCPDGLSWYSVVYAFEFGEATTAASDFTQFTNVTPTKSRLVIRAVGPLVVPLFVDAPVRAATCLYLWECGWGGYDFYYKPVRSARCLWLWKCGYRPRR